MASETRLLVTVRTYPTPSVSNRDVVCTGAVTESREWRRLYPVPLRYLPVNQQFKTWDLIRVKLDPAKRDKRKESRRPRLASIQVESKPLESWEQRVDWLHPILRDSVEEMESRNESIGAVRARRVKDIVFKETPAEWSPRQSMALNEARLFDEPKPLEKVPYEFRFLWEDEAGYEQNSLVISWEMAQAWRSFRRKYKQPNDVLKEKLLGELFSSSRDVSFFMGNHSRFRNVFMVCGWLVPPKSKVQHGLF